jgi:hypothetical protein
MKPNLKPEVRKEMERARWAAMIANGMKVRKNVRRFETIVFLKGNGIEI